MTHSPLQHITKSIYTINAELQSLAILNDFIDIDDIAIDLILGHENTTIFRYGREFVPKNHLLFVELTYIAHYINLLLFFVHMNWFN